MRRGGELPRPLRPWRALGAVISAVLVAGCASATPSPVASRAPVPADVSEAAPVVGGDASATTTADASTAELAVAAPAAVEATAEDQAAPDANDADGTLSLEGFDTRPRSAAASGDAPALLRDVRVGRHEGFERIVFEFDGRSQPEYRIRWSDGAARADGDAVSVAVAGSARLEIVLSPASGVDPSDGTIVYDGPDRVPVEEEPVVMRDLVRTEDFESVLTWSVGASHEVPFRVIALRSPTRVVVDLRSSSDPRERP